MTCSVYITEGQTPFEITKFKGKAQKFCYSPNKPWQKPFIWIIISAFQCFSLKRLIFNNRKYTGKKEGGRCLILGFSLFYGNHMPPALVPRWDRVQFCVLDWIASEWGVSNGKPWKVMPISPPPWAGNPLISIRGSHDASCVTPGELLGLSESYYLQTIKICPGNLTMLH